MFKLRMCNWLCLSGLGCALVAVTQTAAAQSFPSRPLTLVVPFAAGGPSDVAGRIVAQGLSEKLGQQVVVENPAGAGGTLGSLRVAKAPPDGYQFVPGVKRSTKSRPTTRLPISRRSGSSSRHRVRSLPPRTFQQIRSLNSLPTRRRTKTQLSMAPPVLDRLPM
jgi:Tripartite tricarboxylate transporter family receptor